MEKIEVNPSILKWARESLKLTLEDVAARMKKDPVVIQNWENGIDSPTYPQLEKLAYNIYERPLALFFFPEPPEETDKISSFRTIDSEQFDNLPYEIKKLMRKAELYQENLYDLCDNLNPVKEPIFEKVKIKPQEDPLNIAKKIRKELGISLNDQVDAISQQELLKDWRYKVEEAGIFVFKDAFHSENFSGFSIYDDMFPIIYINNSQSKTRQTFTLFHELVHILLKTSGIDIEDIEHFSLVKDEYRKTEAFCNKVTANILLPFKSILEILPHDFELDNIGVIANAYKVSRAVILRRMLEEKLLKQYDYTQLIEKWDTEYRKQKEQRKKTTGNYYRTQMAYFGKHYIDLVFDNYYKQKLSIGQVADFLNMSVKNVNTLEAKFTATI